MRLPEEEVDEEKRKAAEDALSSFGEEREPSKRREGRQRLWFQESNSGSSC